MKNIFTFFFAALLSGSLQAQVNQLAFPLIDGECEYVNYSFTNLAEATTTVVDNPFASGINTSAHVFETDKPMGSAAFAGAILRTDTPIDLSISQEFAINVRVPKANILVSLRLEDYNGPSNFKELFLQPTTPGEWETLTFNLDETVPGSFVSAVGGDYSNLGQVVIIFWEFTPNPFAFISPTTDEKFYFDDIQQVGNSAMPICAGTAMPLDGECEFSTYLFETQFASKPVAAVSNPAPSALNPSNQVFEITPDFFPGTPINYAQAYTLLDQPIDLTIGTEFKLKMWSPGAGANVSLILADFDHNEPNPQSMSYAAGQLTTADGAWEELTFNLQAQPGAPSISHDRFQKAYIVIFGGPSGSYFIDDLVQTGAPVARCSDPTIPTMGQWALLILGLIMSSLGLVFIKRRSIA